MSGAHQDGHFPPLMFLASVLSLRPFLPRALSSWLVRFLMVAVRSELLVVILLILLIRLSVV